MNTTGNEAHLRSETLDAMLAGKADAAAVSHLAGCARCTAEVEQLRTLLATMREGTVDAAAVQLRRAHARQASAVRAGAKWAAPRWAIAAAAAVAVAAGSVSPLLLRHHGPASASRPHAAAVSGTASAESLSDDALLSSVQNDLSSSVPQPLLPLASTSPNSAGNATSQQ